eukprot:CAMPEP_0117457316 /NCGR_PEP_ID=MMETSP0784-20121206/332_1 /TAXON_ID=39447 /ORGANISM="" /LENGTH=175 /DNA_ID=CAMNT_0005250759 /DNA_START=114 /DNA_END=641 /DNA_ORIENTATION=-
MMRRVPAALSAAIAACSGIVHRPVQRSTRGGPGGAHQPSMRGFNVAGGVRAYAPASVADAWQNHFEAFGAQDVEKIMLDYDDTSRVTVYNNADGSKSVFTGVAEIKRMFEGLFADLSDLATLEAPVIDVDEVQEHGGQVFLVWKCPGCGYDTATDTFIFGADKKIKFQNIVVTKK